jgi:hypothetical protein
MMLKLVSMGGVILKIHSVLLVLFALAFGQEGDSVLKTPLTKKLDKYNVSIGVVGIEELKERFKRAYDLLVKYHGEPSKYDTHHLAVSIWKEDEGKIIYFSNYKVEAEVRSPLLRSQRKVLTKYPHQQGENYGEWFQMNDRGLYSITIYITEEKGKVKKVQFDYLQQ